VADRRRLYRVPAVAEQRTIIRFRKNMPVLAVKTDVAPDASRLVLGDVQGREHHFGCGQWSSNGDFTYVATYTSTGREKIYRWGDIVEALEQGWRRIAEPQLGPILAPLVWRALADLEQSANKVNGFIGYEKELAVRILRAVWDEARESLDPDEVVAWSATHGWSLEQAEKLREIAEGVREGRKFREIGGSRAIATDSAHAARMVAAWKAES
jgi:hypothetical protein